MKIGVVDNYDSFTYNLVHYLEEIAGELPLVWMNDAIRWEELQQCTHVVLSPGPGLPKESGELMKVIDTCFHTKKILGVCLGMQALAEYAGGSLKNLEEVQHGVETEINIEPVEENILYQGLPLRIGVGRYHSWVVDAPTLPDCFLPTAKDLNGELMSMQHTDLPVYAVQYHPESIMTGWGKQILRNWLK